MDQAKICPACDAPIQPRVVRCAGCRLPERVSFCRCTYRCPSCAWRFAQADLRQQEALLRRRQTARWPG